MRVVQPPKRSLVVNAPKRYSAPIHPGSGETLLLREDPAGFFVNFMYLHRANQRISRLEIENEKLRRKLEEQQSINETRQYLEVALLTDMLQRQADRDRENTARPQLKLIAKS